MKVSPNVCKGQPKGVEVFAFGPAERNESEYLAFQASVACLQNMIANNPVPAPGDVGPSLSGCCSKLWQAELNHEKEKLWLYSVVK
jgi:hypothetical protein